MARPPSPSNTSCFTTQDSLQARRPHSVRFSSVFFFILLKKMNIVLAVSRDFGCPETSEVPPELTFSCRGALYEGILRQGTTSEVGAVTLYSDLSMIILMYVIGLLAQRHGHVTPAELNPDCVLQSGRGIEHCYFDVFVRKSVLGHLGMGATVFLVDESQRHLVPPTWLDQSYRNFTMQGVVSDGNTYAMGGISGHAGLFSSVPNLYRMMRRLAFADENDPWINKGTVAFFTRVFNASHSTRALGWDTNSALSSTCGTSFAPETFLHTGYTGTQICMDPVEPSNDPSTPSGLLTILLTNRCHPDDSAESSSGMSTIRRSFNTAVKQAYRSKNGI